MNAIVHKDPTGSIEGLKRLIDGANVQAGSGLMIFACDANGFTPDNMNPILCNAPFPVFGGVFPAIIYGKELLQNGTLAAVLPVADEAHFLPDLSTGDADYEAELDRFFPDAQAGQTMMVFVDGLSRRIGAFVEGLFNIFGLDINYIGGGAGSLDGNRKPCLFTNSGMVADGAVIALLSCKSGVGICHGWEDLSGPYQITQANHNTVLTLDWRPAFDVYAEAVSLHSRRPLDKNNFFDVAKGYPFGISRLGTEEIVRDPLSVGEDNSLVCVGEMPEGAFVHIMHGDDQSLIEAAGRALSLAQKNIEAAGKSNLHLFIDCISRVLFLEDRFEKELDAVHRDGISLVGACTIGEIANCGSEFLEFHNKTAVFGAMAIR